jgi:predicted Zn-dependent protease
MNKLILQAGTTIALFFVMWFGLSQVNWIKHLRIDEVQQNTEEKLGELYWELFNEYDGEVKDVKILAPLDSILREICTANDIDPEEIKMHIVENDEINAFALPDKHLVINTGLILAAENEEELTGVICHEIAHMEKNHVMKKLIKEVGLSVLISMTSGNGNGSIIRETAKLLSSSTYDRKLEKEADLTAVEYMRKAKVDAKPFAEFLFRMHLTESKNTKYTSWISSHPLSEKRAEYILEQYGETEKDTRKILQASSWDQLILSLSEE